MVRGSRKGRRGEAGRSRSALSRAMMGDMSVDQPWAGRFTLGTASRQRALCGLAGDLECGRLGFLGGRLREARVAVDRMQIACEDDVGRGEQHRYGATHAVVGQLRKWRTVGAR
jgi:hypothetical protein